MPDLVSVELTLSPTEVPPSYPRDYERLLRLRDGRIVAIRPLLPCDAPALSEAIMTADADTLRRRFLGGRPRLTPAMLTRLTSLDYQRRFALVAAAAGSRRGVAIARYEAVGDRVAEFAIAVDPAWRRIGLATVLVELLAQAALDRGIDEFSMSYLAENRPVAALIARSGGAGKQLIHQGIAEVVMALDREKVDRAVRALQPDFRGGGPSVGPS